MKAATVLYEERPTMEAVPPPTTAPGPMTPVYAYPAPPPPEGPDVVTWKAIRLWGPILLGFLIQTVYLTWVVTNKFNALEAKDVFLENKIDKNNSDMRAEREALYVKKADHGAQMQDVTQKLDGIGKDLNTLTGFIQGREGKR
jgi:hypothetical protein